MDEAEWLANTDPGEMLGFLRDSVHDLLPERKSRLFGIACCHRVSVLLTDPRSRKAVEVCEQYAEGMVTTSELKDAFNIAFDVGHEIADRMDESLAAQAHAAFAASEGSHPNELAESVAEEASKAAALMGRPDENAILFYSARSEL